MARIDSRTHPEFAVEARVLRKALRAITGELESLRNREYSGGDRWVRAKLAEMKRARELALETMLQEPYFGRMDLILPDSDLDQPFYVSKFDAPAVDGVHLVNWATPVGGLFYGGGARLQHYALPGDQRVQAELLLKRQIVISNGQLHRIVDIVDNRGGVVPQDAEEQFLAEQLAERGEMRLADIVRTIQSEQNDLIRAPAGQPMFIQGVAGSGKTSVAYYRLAYLLHPENQTGLTARETLILGPSPLFLSYTQELLPDLGVRDVPQTTFTDMALAQVYAERGVLRNRRARFRRLSGTHQMSVLDSTFELLSAARLSAEREEQAVLASRVRSSLAMRTLIDRYAEELREGILSTQPSAADQVPQYQRALDEVLERQTSGLHDRARQFMTAAAAEALAPARVLEAMPGIVRTAPLGRARVELYRELAWVPADGPRDSRRGELARLLDEHGISEPDERGRWTQRFEAVVDSYVTTLIPELDAPTLYYGLLSETSSLRRLGSDLFSPEELTALASRRPPGRDTVFADDVGAIVALHFHLFGRWITDWQRTASVPSDQPPAEPYRLTISHLIVDEGQDLSPLDYSLLKDLAPTGSMTVLGDISQGVFDYRGLSSWDEALRVLSDLPVRYEEMHRSYRSTKEIVEFCNELLRTEDGLTSGLATPVNRHGPKPGITVLQDDQALHEVVADRIADLVELGYTTIAIVCRSPRHRRRTARWLAESLGPDRVHELDATSSQFGSGVSVLTAGDAKGLEFEAALVMDADPKNYPERSRFARKTLYVGCTRALHILDVFAVGEATSLLQWAAKSHAGLGGVCAASDERGKKCLRYAEAEGRCSSHISDSGKPAAPQLSTRESQASEGEVDMATDVRTFIEAGMREALTWDTAEDLEAATGRMPCANWRAIVAFLADVGSQAERVRAMKYVSRIPQDYQRSVLLHLHQNTQNPAVREAIAAVWESFFHGKMEDASSLPGSWHGP